MPWVLEIKLSYFMYAHFNNGARLYMNNFKNYTVDVNLKFFRSAAQLYNENGPVAATEGSAGFDLRADLDAPVSIAPGQRALVGSGISVEPLGAGVAGFVYSRSGLGAMKGLTVAQGVGVIDPDYRGEIKVALLNTSQETHTVNRGDRIAQLIFQPYFPAAFRPVEELGETRRGAGGFGHTGNK